MSLGQDVSPESGLRERSKLARRARILDALRELLREAPDAAITTDQIAARAGVAPATVYNLIGQRDKIWEALAGWFMDELERRIPETGAVLPQDRAREIVSATVELFLEDPVVSRRMLREWEDSGLVLDRTPLAHVRGALEDARADGVLHSDADVRMLASVIGAACVGALHQWAAGLIDEERFRTRALQALDVAMAAGRP
jgi:AcrR family transcriptional regulator